MKKILLSLGLLAGTIYANAGERFAVNLGDQNNVKNLYFEILDDSTCQVASAENYELGTKEVWINGILTEVQCLIVKDKDGSINYENNATGPNYCQYDNLVIPSKVKYMEKEYTVTRIGEGSFANNLNYIPITIPETVTEIGFGAFFGANFNGLTLKGRVKSIGDYAFYESKLQNIDLSNIETIGNYAFYHNQLQSVNLKDVETIGDYAFSQNQIQSANLNGVKSIGNYAFSNNNLQNTFTFPASLTYIGEGAIAHNTNVKEIIFEDGDEPLEIGKNLGEGCTGLSKITFPTNLETIPDEAFKNANSLKTVIFKEGLKHIGNSAFANCGIDELVIPSTVIEICANAFNDNNQLQKLTFAEVSNLTTIGDYAFYNCSALKGDLIFPDSLLEIGDYGFTNIKSLSRVIFGKNLRSVGTKSFYHVKVDGQDYWELPASLTEIGENAFNITNRVTGFTDIYYPNSNPNDIDRQAFGTVEENGEVHTYEWDYWVYATVCLHVPIGTREKYKQCEGWKYFKCIIDDLLPENPSTSEDGPAFHTDEEDPLTYILDYIYLIPGQHENLNDILGQTDSVFGEWEAVGDGHKDFDILALDKDGNVEAKSFGNHIAIAKRNNYIFVEGEEEPKLVSSTLAGAVVIFVCPTYTVIYDKNNLTDGNIQYQGDAAASKAKAAPKYRAEEETDPTLVDNLMKENSTYTHPVLPSSFPKVQITPVQSITIVEVERGNLDEGNHVTDNKAGDDKLLPVDSDLYDETGEGGYTGSIVPKDPVKENHVIAVTLSMNAGTPTGVDKVELDSKISVLTSNHTLQIVGADEDSVVTVANLNGQIEYQGTHKVIQLEPGIYVIKVEDVSFKVLVK